VAHGAVPFRNNILKTCSLKRPLRKQEFIFFHRLWRARRVADNAFGVMVSNF
jgi:hypothetical protein